MQIRYVDGPRLRRSLLAAIEHARGSRAELNRINVFPVPDGDTGTNLVLTVGAIADRLRGFRERRVSEVAKTAAEAAVLGARGNCGMMLSHFLLGFAEDMGERERVTADELAGAFQAGAETLQHALERPVEGTILTVIRDTARTAVEVTTADIGVLLHEVVREARASLERTPDLLPALRKAGVVDAGAMGFVSLLEGVHRYILGEPLQVEPSRGEASREEPAAPHGSDLDLGVERPPESAVMSRADYPEEERSGFCTEALVRGTDLPDERAVRGRLRDRGDSLIVIRTGDSLKVHIHTEDPEAVFRELRSMGSLVTHKAEDMAEQHRVVVEAARQQREARRPVGIVTDTACDLPDEVLRAHGIRMVPLQLVADEETYRDRLDISPEEFVQRLEGEEALYTTSQPSPGAFVEAYRDAGADAEELVAVLLGSGLSGTFGAAETAAGLVDDPVTLVDTQGLSVLQGLLVLKAAELAEKGRSPSEIRETLMEIRDRSGILLTVDRFDRLLASGRIGKGTAWVGSTLGVKPILAVSREGKVVPAGTAFGRKRVLPALMRRVEKALGKDSVKVRFGVVHVGCEDVVDDVTAALEARWPGAEILTGPATAVIATHVGVGAWAVAYMVEETMGEREEEGRD